MITETNVPLQQHNTFGIAARAERLLRLRTMDDVHALLTDPLRLEPHFVLGGGSNIVITGDIKRLVIKVELMGKQLVSEDDKAWVIQAASGFRTKLEDVVDDLSSTNAEAKSAKMIAKGNRVVVCLEGNCPKDF